MKFAVTGKGEEEAYEPKPWSSSTKSVAPTESIPIPLTKVPFWTEEGLLVKLLTLMDLPSSLTSITSLVGSVMLYSVNMRAVFGLLPMLSDTSNVATEAKFEAVSSVGLPLVIGFPPSGGNTIEPFAPDTMLPKFMSRFLVINIGATTMQEMLA